MLSLRICVLTALLARVIAAPADYTSNAIEARDALCRRTSIKNNGVYSLPCSTYSNSITCPRGVQGKKGGTVLLVHGTGSTGAETWKNGPYNLMLPDEGYDVCWIDLPNRALSDAQVSAEYIAWSIYHLAAGSSTGKVSLISHSQGGLNVQWALNFWPAQRGMVHSFFAIAPDFHGTAEGPLACLALDLATGGCNPSVIQQSVGSTFLDAINAKGNQALVPTTVAFTRFDDVIQPEVLIPPTSRLNGANVYSVQEICGIAYIQDHFTMTVASAAYYLGLDALKNGVGSKSRVNKLSCLWTLNDVLLANFDRAPAVLRQVVHDALAVVTYPKVKSEPLIKAYVCQRGDLKVGCASS